MSQLHVVSRYVTQMKEMLQITWLKFQSANADQFAIWFLTPCFFLRYIICLDTYCILISNCLLIKQEFTCEAEFLVDPGTANVPVCLVWLQEYLKIKFENMCDITVHDNNKTMSFVKTVDNRPVSLTDSHSFSCHSFQTTNSLNLYII